MKTYSLSLVRSSFIKKVQDLSISKSTADSIKSSLINFFQVKNILNSKLFDKIYVSYSNEFHFDDAGLHVINNILMKKHSLFVELQPESVDHFVISDYDNMASAIQKIKLQLQNPEHRSKKEENKELRKEQNKIRIDFDNYFNGPMPQNIKNKKIISLDFEYDQNKDFLIFECGITLFNKGKIEHQHYLIEENYTKKSNVKYNNQFQFNFGDSKIVPLSQFLKIIESQINDSEYILAHSLKSEYYVLKHYGIDFAKTDIIPIDSQKIFYCNFRNDVKHKNVSLEALLQMLDIFYENLHNAGNDAAYTMQSVLKMHDVIHKKIQIPNVFYIPKRAKRFNHV